MVVSSTTHEFGISFDPWVPQSGRRALVDKAIHERISGTVSIWEGVERRGDRAVEGARLENLR